MKTGVKAETPVGRNLVPFPVKTPHETLNRSRTAKVPVGTGAATH